MLSVAFKILKDKRQAIVVIMGFLAIPIQTSLSFEELAGSYLFASIATLYAFAVSSAHLFQLNFLT